MRGVRQLKLFASIFFVFILAYIVFADVVLVAPGNNTFTNGTNDTIAFVFNYAGSLGEVNSTLFIDNIASGTNISTNVSVNTTIFANRTLAEGFHNWTVNSTNATGASNVSTTFFFTIDRTNPAVFELRPVAASVFNVSNIITISVNATDNATISNVSFVRANITFSNSTTQLLTLFRDGSTDKYNNTFTAPGLIGVYNVSYFANDSANNINSTGVTNFTVADVVIPAVFDVRPTAGSVFNVSNVITLSANATDDVAISSVRANVTLPNASVQVVTLTRDGTTDKYNNTFTIPGAIGVYNVTFTANDTTNNINGSIRTNFTVNDVVAPAVFEVKPALGSAFNTTNVIEIGVNVTDDVAVGQVRANVTLPNASVQVLTLSLAIGNKYNASFTIPEVIGTYNITFIANDTTNNINSTTKTNFTAADAGAPVISSISTGSITTSSAVVSWTTNENANSSVNYGTTAALGTSVSNSSAVTSHSISLTSLSSSTLYFYNVSSCDSSGNCATNGTFNFTTSAPAAATTPSSGGGGGSSGPLGITGTPYSTTGGTDVIKSLTKLWSSLSPAEDAIFEVSVAEIPITRISFSVNREILQQPSMRIGLLASRPSVTPMLDAVAYSFIEIIKTQFTNADIVTGNVEFQVPKTWLTQQSVNREIVSLYALTDSGLWEESTTDIKNEDEEFIYYEAATPHFSYFAIAAATTQPTVTEQPQQAERKSEETGPAQESAKTNWPAAVVVLVILATAIYFLFIRRKPRH